MSIVVCNSPNMIETILMNSEIYHYGKAYSLDRKVLWSTASKNKYVNVPNVYVIIQESVASSKAATAE